MSLSITYTTTYANWTVSDYLADWAGYFGDHGNNSGAFYQGGIQYGVVSWITDAGLIGEGHLAYGSANTLYGDLDSISLGTDVVQTGSGFALGGWEATFSGLGLSTDVADLTTTNQGIVHEVIYGLMSGDATALEGVLNGLLDDYGVSTADTFDVVAAALAAGPLSVESAETVGVQAYAEELALVA